jgi:YHS domain-containing protein
MLVAELGANPAAAQTPPVYLSNGAAISGYDPVAYFTEKKPVKGNPAIAFEHGGAKYFFASEANRDTFKKEPEKYAPQYGGYCAWAVAQGSTASSDPNAWTIHDGKLFLNYSQSVRSTWEKDIPGNVTKGDANWPKLVGKK